MKQRLFMIQGFYFFAYHGKPLQYFHFAGMIHPSEDGQDIFAGQLSDTVGDSILSDIEISDEKVTFKKKYENRSDTIFYTLFKSTSLPNLWVGFYEGTRTGRNRVKCLITEVPMEFLSTTLV